MVKVSFHAAPAPGIAVETPAREGKRFQKLVPPCDLGIPACAGMTINHAGGPELEQRARPGAQNILQPTVSHFMPDAEGKQRINAV